MSDDALLWFRRDTIQELGEHITVWRLRDVPNIPIEFGDLTIIMYGRDREEEHAQKAVIAVVVDPGPRFRQVELVDSHTESGRASWIRGVLAAADSMNRRS